VNFADAFVAKCDRELACAGRSMAAFLAALVV
jgi:hypothetical protein